MLARLEVAARRYGPGCSAVKRRLLAEAERRWFGSARTVLRLHEVLCFLRAYPDDPALLARVERMLGAFDRRGDVCRHRAALADTGIVGTTIHYRFFWPMARWLAARWPDRLFLEWDDAEAAARVARALPGLVTPVEAESLRALGLPARAALERLRPRDRTDASFWVEYLESMAGDEFAREALHDTVDAPYRLEPGADTPSRTRARYARAPVVFRDRPPSRERPDLAEALARPPRAVRAVAPREARRLIDLAMAAMVTRARDLEAFGWADPRDVRLVDDGDGLQFACIGVRPSRRQLLHAAWGQLMLRNGVPVGYVQADVLLGSAAVSYNTFETFRAGEAAHLFARMLSSLRHVFGAVAFHIEPYQLGRDNAEGLASGAWWFYSKLGFAPRDARVRRLAQRERRRVEADPGHRSSPPVLRRLAAAPLFYSLERPAVELPPTPWGVGLTLLRDLADSAGGDRRRALDAARVKVGRLLGVGSMRGWTADERQMWERWCPLVLALPGIARFGPGERRELTRIIRAKAGRSESRYLELSARHPRFGRALADWLRARRIGVRRAAPDSP